ncbi:MAG TPA: hypothetical protein VFC46_15925 [Humisphaera sp.]|nr:hypothetical protein [Humisphaera sp.]
MKSRTGAKTRFLAAVLSVGSVLLPILGTGNAARAADQLKEDARLEGYKERVILDAGGAQYYLLLGLLGIICVSVMFKDAKRSHLD